MDFTTKSTTSAAAAALAIVLAIALLLCGCGKSSDGEGANSSAAGASSQPSSNETDEAGDKAIKWVDPVFEALIREFIDKPTGDIYQSELDHITMLQITGDNSIGINNWAKDGSNYSHGIVDIASLERIINGVTYTERGEISSVEDVKNFRNLSWFSVMFNSIVDVSPLADMKSLRNIFLCGNLIEDISPLFGLNLYTLDVSGNRISSVAGIDAVQSTLYLVLSHNNISDISPLAEMEFYWLEITGNPITDLSPLEHLGDIVVN